MLVEPDLDRRELAAALDRHHGLAPLALRFVPAGETAWCWLAGLRLAVFELVDGDPLDDRALADPGMAGRVARLVAAIHAATPASAVPVPPVERFEVAADELGRRLAALDPQAGAAADGLAAEARTLVWPQRRALLDLVGR